MCDTMPVESQTTFGCSSCSNIRQLLNVKEISELMHADAHSHTHSVRMHKLDRCRTHMRAHTIDALSHVRSIFACLHAQMILLRVMLSKQHTCGGDDVAVFVRLGAHTARHSASASPPYLDPNFEEWIEL